MLLGTLDYDVLNPAILLKIPHEEVMCGKRGFSETTKEDKVQASQESKLTLVIS